MGSGRVKAAAACATDVGRKRRHNEDTPVVEPDLGVFAVFDGVGGHSKGDVASGLAAATVIGCLADPGSVPEPPAVNGATSAAARRLLAAVHMANAEVIRESGQVGAKGGMGSTVVAALVDCDEGLVHVCHVGDSRCYRARGGKLELLTSDHNVINDALRIDPNLPEELLRDLPKNVVTRALGMKEEVEPDLRSEEARGGDVYVLCSDGLTGMVSDEQIAAVVERAGDLSAACNELVAMANAAGGVDNVTVVLVRIEPADPTEATEFIVEETTDDSIDVSVDDGVAVAVGRVVAVEGLAEPVDPPPAAPSEPPPSSTRTCPSCGAPYQHGAKFCGECGEARLHAEVARCGRCGADLFVGTVFCVECGAPHNFFEDSVRPPD